MNMFKQLFENSNWLGKLLQLIIVCFLFLMISSLIWTSIFGRSTDITSLKTLQLFNAVFVFVLPVVFLSRYWYKNPVSELSINKFPSAQQVLLVVALIISVQPFVNLTAYLNEQIQFPSAFKNIEKLFREYELRAEKMTADFLAVKTWGGYLVNLMLIALIPAVSEELFFRGAVQNIFSEKFQKHTSVWITAAIFSLIHFQMYGFFSRMILGAILGYLLVWSKTLWLPVIAHFVNNALGVTAGFLRQDNPISVQRIDDLGKADTFIFGILSGIISLFVLWIIYHLSRKSSLPSMCPSKKGN